ncbi:MarR family transcriptional regulator [Streptococcus agalactiae LMG 14747]|uniref:MarR family transcriptional regulator n=1 Tax=Streptococcus agalactiae LMG 14747 TaxID=1154860 RepID=V6Z3I7_STRAG|nr:MarR family transcriptional regulator [Streptococcus agalactiae LMG 14747]
MENPLQKYKHLIGELEQSANEIAQKHHIEHLGGPQGKVLYYLFKHQDRDIFVKDIEQWLAISKSVASNLVKRMEKNGFIRLETSSRDKRYKRLVLTEEGMSKIAPLETFHIELMKVLFAGIDPQDRMAVDRIYHQLRQNNERYRDGKTFK